MKHWDTDALVTLLRVGPYQDYEAMLGHLLPEAEWRWYDLYLRVLYDQPQGVLDVPNRIRSLAFVLNAKEEGNVYADMYFVWTGEAIEPVLRKGSKVQAVFERESKERAASEMGQRRLLVSRS